MTASTLLAALTAAGCRPAAEGEDLILHHPPPPALVSALEVLHTGVRAALTGQRWFGLDPVTGRPCGPYPTRGTGPLAFGALDPARELPPAVGLLGVERDTCWDRLHPLARLDQPALFAPSVVPGPKSR